MNDDLSGVRGVQAGAGCDLGINTPSQWLAAFAGRGDVVRKIPRADNLVMFGRVMFREIIGKVFSRGSPAELELLLCGSVFEPPISHVHGFCSALFDGVMDETEGGGVVKDDLGGRLLKSHFGEGEANGDGLFAIVERGTNFAVGGGGGDVF